LGEPVQLTMFADAEPAPRPRKPLPPNGEKVLDKLRKLDVMRMTPLQALEWLNDIKNLLVESGDSH